MGSPFARATKQLLIFDACAMQADGQPIFLSPFRSRREIIRCTGLLMRGRMALFLFSFPPPSTEAKALIPCLRKGA